MRSILLAAAIAVLPLAAWADAPEFWVEGLALPVGARAVEREVLPVTADSAARYDLTSEGIEQEILAVSFDSVQDWPALEQHFADSLAAQGYRRFALEQLTRRLIRKDGRSRAEAAQKAQKVLQLAGGIVLTPVQEYAAAGSDLYIVLMDMQKTNELAVGLATKLNQPEPRLGRYSLMVARLADPVVADADVRPNPQPATDQPVQCEDGQNDC
jgi:hypothetical protein